MPSWCCTVLDSVPVTFITGFFSLRLPKQHFVDWIRLLYCLPQKVQVHTAPPCVTSMPSNNEDTAHVPVGIFYTTSAFSNSQSFRIHLWHSHRVLMTLSCEKEPSHGIFFHFPFSFIRIILLAMYTTVYTTAFNHSSSCDFRSKAHQQSQQIRASLSRMVTMPHSWHLPSPSS